MQTLFLAKTHHSPIRVASVTSLSSCLLRVFPGPVVAADSRKERKVKPLLECNVGAWLPVVWTAGFTIVRHRSAFLFEPSACVCAGVSVRNVHH